MRQFITIALMLACSALGLAQDYNKKVTYHADSIPLKQVCEDITTTTGIPIGASGTLNKMIMVIDVHDITMQEFMEKLKDAVEADWVSDGTTSRLTRTTGFIRKRESDRFQWRVTAIKKAQKKMAERLAKEAAFDNKTTQDLISELETIMKGGNQDSENMNRWRQFQKLRDKLPKKRLADRIALSFSPDVIATIPDLQRVVFSTSPNQMQRPLPRAALPFVQQFIREQNLWAEAVGKIPLPDMESGQNIDWESYQILQDRKRIEETPQKLLVILSSSYGNQGVNIEVRLLNAKGKTITNSTADFSTSGFGDVEDNEEMNKRMQKLRADAANEAPIELSPLSAEMRSLLSRSMGGQPAQEKKPVSEELKNAILNPEKYDPLRLGASEVLFAAAKSKNLQLVAAPPDFLMMVTSYTGDTKGVRASEVLGMLAMVPDGISPFKLDDKWLICNRGDYSDFQEMNSADRYTLGKILRQINQDKRISLDTQCQIALAEEGNDTFYSLYMMLSQILVDRNMSEMAVERSGNRYMLRLHGLLTPGQKATLLNGSKLPYNQLTPQQRQIVFDMVFKSSRYDGGMPMAIEAEGMEVDPEEGMQEWTPDEPTEMFPTGIPPETTISLDLSNNAVLMVEQSYDGQNFYTQPMDPQSIGYHLAMKEAPGREAGPDDYYSRIEWKSFKPAQQTNWLYTFTFKPKNVANHQLSDTVGNGQKVTSIDKLPADIQEKIKKAKEEMIKNLKNQQRPPGDGGGGGGFQRFLTEFFLS